MRGLRFLSFLICFELLVGPFVPHLSPHFGLQNPYANAQSCPNSLIWVQSQNRCLTSEEVGRIIPKTSQCPVGDDECFRRNADAALKEAGENNNNYQATQKMGGKVVSNAMSALALAAPLIMITSSIKDKVSTCSSISFWALAGGSAALAIGEKFANYQHKQRLKKIQEEGPTPKDGDNYELQKIAFEKLAKSEESMAMAAKTKKDFYTVALSTFSAAAAMALFEIIWPNSALCDTREEKETKAAAEKAAADKAAEEKAAVAQTGPTLAEIATLRENEEDAKAGYGHNNNSVGTAAEAPAPPAAPKINIFQKLDTEIEQKVKDYTETHGKLSDKRFTYKYRSGDGAIAPTDPQVLKNDEDAFWELKEKKQKQKQGIEELIKKIDTQINDTNTPGPQRIELNNRRLKLKELLDDLISFKRYNPLKYNENINQKFEKKFASLEYSNHKLKINQSWLTLISAINPFGSAQAVTSTQKTQTNVAKSRFSKIWNNVGNALYTPLGRSILAGVLAGWSLIMIKYAKEQMNVSNNRAELLYAMASQFDAATDHLRPCSDEDNNNPNVPKCFCYTPNSSSRSATANHPVCRNLRKSFLAKSEAYQATEQNEFKSCINRSANEDPNCDCKKNNSCFNLQMKEAFVGINPETSKMIQTALSPLTSISNGAEAGRFQNTDGIANHAVNLFRATEKLAEKLLPPAQKKEREKLSNEFESKAIEMSSGLPTPVDTTTSKPLPSSPAEAAKMFEKELQDKSENASSSSPEPVSSPVVSMPQGGEEKMDLGFSSESEAIEENNVAEVMKKDLDYGENDVNSAHGPGLFEVLTQRYQKSGMRRLFKE